MKLRPDHTKARDERREQMIDKLADQIEDRYRMGLVADDLEMAMADLIDDAKKEND